jgi:hypothetical protein
VIIFVVCVFGLGFLVMGLVYTQYKKGIRDATWCKKSEDLPLQGEGSILNISAATERRLAKIGSRMKGGARLNFYNCFNLTPIKILGFLLV